MAPGPACVIATRQAGNYANTGSNPIAFGRNPILLARGFTVATYAGAAPARTGCAVACLRRSFRPSLPASTAGARHCLMAHERPSRWANLFAAGCPAVGPGRWARARRWGLVPGDQFERGCGQRVPRGQDTLLHWHGL